MLDTLRRRFDLFSCSLILALVLFSVWDFVLLDMGAYLLDEPYFITPPAGPLFLLLTLAYILFSPFSWPSGGAVERPGASACSCPSSIFSPPSFPCWPWPFPTPGWRKWRKAWPSSPPCKAPSSFTASPPF